MNRCVKYFTEKIIIKNKLKKYDFKIKIKLGLRVNHWQKYINS